MLILLNCKNCHGVRFNKPLSDITQNRSSRSPVQTLGLVTWFFVSLFKNRNKRELFSSNFNFYERKECQIQEAGWLSQTNLIRIAALWTLYLSKSHPICEVSDRESPLTCDTLHPLYSSYLKFPESRHTSSDPQFFDRPLHCFSQISVLYTCHSRVT